MADKKEPLLIKECNIFDSKASVQEVQTKDMSADEIYQYYMSRKK